MTADMDDPILLAGPLLVSKDFQLRIGLFAIRACVRAGAVQDAWTVLRAMTLEQYFDALHAVGFDTWTRLLLLSPKDLQMMDSHNQLRLLREITLH